MRFAYSLCAGLGAFATLAVAAVAGCASPDGVLVELNPAVVSSLDGATSVRAMVVADSTPLVDQPVTVTVAYTDRLGRSHDIAPIDGRTDAAGRFEAPLAGFDWDGSGTVTVSATDEAGVAGEAAFIVLDRTPPQVEILPPTTDLRVGPGLPLDVQVRVQDEIGVSQVVIEAAGSLDRQRSTVIASGSGDATLTFRFDVPDNAAAGPTVTLYALATDLSGNRGTASAVVLTVDPSIVIATPPGLVGELVVDGTAQRLDDPRGVAVSPRDGQVYVADNAGPAPCNGACIRKVDPTSGVVDAAAVITGVGTMEGVTFDASGDNLYFTDRQRRIGHMTWNAQTMRYDAAGFCNDVAVDNPVEPYHLVVDATLGLLVVDDDRQRVAQALTCNATAQPTGLTGQVFDQPRGIALGPAGEIYVSDLNQDEILRVDRSGGPITTFQGGGVPEPWGIAWVGGTSAFADTLLVALSGDQRVVSTAGTGTRTAVYLRNDPIDVTVAGGTAYVLTRPSGGSRGRLFRVSGF
jgi:DNA-binding beta-propeller fold protein YncE